MNWQTVYAVEDEAGAMLTLEQGATGLGVITGSVVWTAAHDGAEVIIGMTRTQLEDLRDRVAAWLERTEP